jgi:hypothetical protein
MRVPPFMKAEVIEYFVDLKLVGGTNLAKEIYEVQCYLTPRERVEAEKQLKCVRARQYLRRMVED